MEDRSLLQIKLEKDLGYFFGVFHSGRKIGTVTDFIYVHFPHFTDEKLNWKKIDFKKNDLLVYPIQVWGRLLVRGEHKVKVIGVLDEDQESFFRPHYLHSAWNLDKVKKNESMMVENFLLPTKSYPYYRVKHFPLGVSCSPHALRRNITLAWINENDWDVADFYSKKERKENYWIDLEWEELMRRPKYTSIPNEFRNKPKPIKKVRK